MTIPRSMQDQPERGRSLARALGGSWHQAASQGIALDVESAAALVPTLVDTGAGGLAWWRLRGSPASRGHGVRPLRDAFRCQAFDTVGHVERLAGVVDLLRAAGIEPILLKGWSVARLYPAPGVCPCGDIDLCVRPDQMAAATTILTAAGPRVDAVDLHSGIADLDDRAWDDIFDRSRLVPLGPTAIRILGSEDQLRHLCLHLLRHGAWRPLWLCDIGAALESRPADFDWAYCLSADSRAKTDWVVCAIGLANRLLGARIDSPDILRRMGDLPHWLEATVLNLWSLGAAASDLISIPWAVYPRTWAGLSLALRHRWPNPIGAAFKLGLSPFTRLPLPLIQAATLTRRALLYAKDRLRSVGERRSSHIFAIHPAVVR